MGVEEGGFEPEAAAGVGAAEDGGPVGEEGAADVGDGVVVGVAGAEEDGGDGGVFVELQLVVLVDELGQLGGVGADVVDEVGEAVAAERP
ncbi:hypothetical protein V3O60_27955 [Streptomyces xanthochromogenes]